MINQCNGLPGSGIFSTVSRRIVFDESALNISCDTGITGVVLASDYIDVPCYAVLSVALRSVDHSWKPV